MFFELGKPFLSCPDSERPCPDIRHKVGNDLLEKDSPEHVLEQEKPALIQHAMPGSKGDLRKERPAFDWLKD